MRCFAEQRCAAQLQNAARLQHAALLQHATRWQEEQHAAECAEQRRAYETSCAANQDMAQYALWYTVHTATVCPVVPHSTPCGTQYHTVRPVVRPVLLSVPHSTPCGTQYHTVLHSTAQYPQSTAPYRRAAGGAPFRRLRRRNSALSSEVARLRADDAAAAARLRAVEAELRAERHARQDLQRVSNGYSMGTAAFSHVSDTLGRGVPARHLRADLCKLICKRPEALLYIHRELRCLARRLFVCFLLLPACRCTAVRTSSV